LRLRPPLRLPLPPLLLLAILADFVFEYPLSRRASYTFQFFTDLPGMAPGCAPPRFPGTRACASLAAMTAPEGSNLAQRAGFAVGVRIGRVKRALHYQRHPLQVIPRLGPWFMTYGHDRGMDTTGVRVNVASCEANVSGGLKGHPGVIAGVRWRAPGVWDRSWSRQFRLDRRGIHRA
jgi:hypothetical protein